MRRKLVLTIATAAVAAVAISFGGLAYADRELGSGSGSGSGDADTKIIGGRPATEDYKFHASLQLKDQGDRPTPHQCGGSLIAPEWVLTAAHCVAEVDGTVLDPADYHINIGSNDYLDGEQIDAAAFEVHPYWGTDHESMADIALIKLEHASSEKPVAMSLHPASDTRVLGWGRTVEDDPTSIPRVAQELDTKLLNFDECKQGDEFDITPGDLCIDIPNGDSGPCFGDSGSPAMFKSGDTWRIFGVTSRGPGQTGCLNGPMVYTNIDWWADWIAETSGQALTS